jgi:CDP-glucose 4,6-dehydratase
MHVLVTGHTGFKGAWLTLLLRSRGHEVSGIALDPEPDSLFEVASIAGDVSADHRVDIRDAERVRAVVRDVRPDAVMHLAAQPLVRESYRDPRTTIETNVIGTMNMLDAAREAGSVQATVIVTTDKVYRNVNQVAGYVEADPLGGHDPYSASKAMADLLTQSWMRSFEGPRTVIARAGNVIGGGDVSADRLLPDLVRAFASGSAAQIRYPGAVRPWQHVLDCLNGYCVLLDAVLTESTDREAWNFGPGPDSFRTVAEVADLAVREWGSGAAWEDVSEGTHPHEAELLALDASAARTLLGWDDRLTFTDAVQWTIDWHLKVRAGSTPREVTMAQLDAFAAQERNA